MAERHSTCAACKSGNPFCYVQAIFPESPLGS